MNIAVFGATGAIGSLTVAELLERGHIVTAYARNAAKVPAGWDDRVRVHRHGVRRYVGHATPSVLDPREKPTLQTRLPTFLARTFLRRAYNEVVALSSLVMDSGLDWTIVRFTAPKNGPATGRVRAGFYGTDRIGLVITRADIAAFTASQVEDDTYRGAAPAISN